MYNLYRHISPQFVSAQFVPKTTTTFEASVIGKVDTCGTAVAVVSTSANIPAVKYRPLLGSVKFLLPLVLLLTVLLSMLCIADGSHGCRRRCLSLSYFFGLCWCWHPSCCWRSYFCLHPFCYRFCRPCYCWRPPMFLLSLVPLSVLLALIFSLLLTSLARASVVAAFLQRLTSLLLLMFPTLLASLLLLAPAVVDVSDVAFVYLLLLTFLQLVALLLL